MKKILFTGGGSAGHVIPNIALMEEILSEGWADVCYMGTDGIEKGLISEWKLPYYEIECPKLVRGGGFAGFRRNLKIPRDLYRAQKQAETGLKIFQPDLVFSKGGYVALPVVRAAKKLHIPCFAHESDLSVGLANRLTAGKCKYLFTSFPETAKKIRRGQYSGAPIRRSVFSATKAEARRKLSIPFDAKTVLIFGGGSGSAVINEEIRKNVKRLCEKYVLLHVCGKGNIVECTFKNYRQFEFIADMGMAYACSDLVVSRSGSGTVFEVLALKKPALFIPLEGQTRGDQIENAEYFQKRGLCHILRQKNIGELPEKIEETMNDEQLKSRLNDSDFSSGNKNILRAMRAVLGI